MSVYAKAIVAVIMAGLTTAAPAFIDDGAFSAVEWINVAISVVTAIGVFYVPNAPNGTVAKSVIAGLTAALALAVQLIAGGFTVTEWVQLAFAFVSALGVYGVRNGAKPAHVV